MTDIQQYSPSAEILRAILWQYEGAERIVSLILSKQEWMDEYHSGFWRDWYRDVFDLDTANDFGLSVWGRILDIPLGVDMPANARDRLSFGFGPDNLNFEQGNFGRGRDETISLTTEQKRLVLKLRYFQLTHRPSVPQINRFLNELFGDLGRVFVVDPLDMSYAVYFFGFTPDASLRFILENYDILPRPSTVGAEWQVQVKDSFGFGVEHLNFENGNFGA